ncbi:MAG: VCBS repeat-containing protein, partial [Euryarchaeota archaeon]|nr:VCBS repeat-containing protein [Euryarchaeota archaeon]
LLRRNQDPWIPGTNYYSLRIRLLSDSGYASTTPESYQMLATSIQVVAPLSTIDIVASTEEGPVQKGRGVDWSENEFYWRETTIDIIPKDGKKPTAMATGDLNGDTKVDVVVGLDSQEITNVIAYYNLDYGTTWRREFINQFQGKANYRAESLAIGDLDGDGDGEIIAGIKDAAGGTSIGVIVFWNDGSWTGQELRYSETGAKPNMQSLAVGDINRDGRPDVVSGDKNGVVDYYCNNVRGSWLFPKTTPCPTQATLQPPGNTESINRGVKVGKAGEIPYNSLALGQMEGLSFELRPDQPTADKTLDIVVANNQNLIIYRTTVTYDQFDDAYVATFTRYDLVYTGDANNRKVQSLAVGDMNADGMNDIVYGIDPDKEKSGVFRLRNMGMRPPPSTTFETWVSILLPHTVVDPKTGKIADLGLIKDLVLGDTDGDGDLDIVFLNANDPNDFLNNIWAYENVGDDKTTYVETNVFTDGWFKRKEKAFALDIGYIDL